MIVIFFPFRYNQKVVWRFLLGQSELKINLQNEHGQTALHTAARFDIPEAALDLLRRSDVDTNLRSDLGSSPAMVATKYASKETLSVLTMDPRVRMDVVDNQERGLKDVIGAAIIECDKNLMEEIQLILDFGNMTLVPKSSSETADEGYFTTSSTGSRVTL